jgi:predicted nuclease with RNAse H fold
MATAFTNTQKSKVSEKSFPFYVISMKFIGIDLAGSEKRETGFCILQGKKVKAKILHSDEEIISETLSELQGTHDKIVAIDAPLFLPLGRKTIESRGPHFRVCDLELRKMKIKFFPISLGPMRMLTKRGIALREMLEDHGIKVLETYPGAVYDIFHVERNDGKIKAWLKRIGIRTKPGLTRHELDAIACALVAQAFSKGKAIAIGEKSEGYMYLPRPE